MTEKIPSIYQQAVFDWIANRKPGSNLMVDAVAGSGKTTTAVWGFDFVEPDTNAVFLAFNKHIQIELQNRLPKNAACMTYHAMGLKIITKAVGRVQIDADKIEKHLKQTVEQKLGFLFPAIRRLVGVCKGSLLDFENDEVLEDAVYTYNVDLYDDVNPDNKYIAFELVRDCMEYSKAETSIVDFDDMIWMPIANNYSPIKYDLVMVDEVQDTNPAQMVLAQASVSKSGNIIGLGDRYQSIYGWRGADVDAIPNLIDALCADTLPLSITYRNPKSIVNLVKQKFPYITIENAEWAEDGQIGYTTSSQFLETVKPGDMVLCRCNAPLVPPVFALIRKGVKATIKGRDIGNALKTIIKKITRYNGHDIYKFLRDLEVYREKESYKLRVREKHNMEQKLQDQIDTLVALSDGADSVDEVTKRIDTVFDENIQGIAFSSVHKAKGLEAQNVYILAPELMPHPMAKKPVEQQAERNVEYVAITRTLDTLTYVVQR